MRSLLPVLILISLLLQGPPPARADLIGMPQLPPSAKISMPPNVLLILDHSGSMGSGPGSRWEKARATLQNILQTYGDQGIRFGLMRMDGSNHDGTDQPVDGQAVIRQGGRILSPCGTPAAEISAYLDAWTQSNRPQTWTNLAETLADAGRYFATALDHNGERSGRGPAGFGFYSKNYATGYAGQNHAATNHDDRGTRIDTTSPISLACQKNFVIFITDGIATYDNDWSLVTALMNSSFAGDLSAGDSVYADDSGRGCPTDGCTYFDDVAAYLYASDLRTDLGTGRFEKQNLVTHVIGFEEDHPLLEAAAAQGHGLYLNANAADDSLHEALVTILEEIRRKVASATSVAVATQSTTERMLLRTLFHPREGTGDLQAFSLPLPEALPADFYANPLWSAADQLAGRDPGSRRLFTTVSDNGRLRKEAFGQFARPHLQSVWDLPAAQIAARMEEIRALPLGTIIHATPVVVGPPKFHHTTKGYAAFRNRWKNRPTLIYTGANDGMLHAFHAAGSAAFPSRSAGDEAWAYIPAGIQSALETAAGSSHRYLVDLPPVANDVWDRSWDVQNDDEDGTSADGDGWRTVLIGSGRLGTEDYFALDITDPTAQDFDVLWERSPHPGARASTKPLLDAIETPDGGQSAAVFTAGYREDAGNGGICVLGVRDARKLAIWQGSGAGSGTAMEVPGKSPQNAYYTMSDPVGFDADGNGLIDVIYAGDSEGILWKFYYDFATRAWRKNARFATGGQPITGRPTLAPDRLGNLRVYFGTGRSLVDLDRQDTSRNAFYCLIEKRRKLPRKGVADPNAGRFTWAPAVSDGPDDLLDVTTLRSAQDIEGLGEEERSTLEETGWFFDLGATGEQPAERVTTRAQVLAGVVFFTSFTPSEDPCSFGGDSRLYAISWDSGLQARFDLEETVLKTENGGNLPQGKRYGELGSAEAAGLCWDGGSARGSAESRLLLQSGDGALETRRIRLPERRMSLLGWREIDH